MFSRCSVTWCVPKTFLRLVESRSLVPSYGCGATIWRLNLWGLFGMKGMRGFLGGGGVGGGGGCGGGGEESIQSRSFFHNVFENSKMGIPKERFQL